MGRNLALKLKDDYRVILTARNNKQNFFAKQLTGCEVAPMDVVNIESVRDTFSEFQPHIVIHAAATKFVDLSEKYPMECIDVNVVGSQNIARVAVEKGVNVTKSSMSLVTCRVQALSTMKLLVGWWISLVFVLKFPMCMEAKPY